MIYQPHHIPTNLSKYVREMVYIKDYHPEHLMDSYLPDGSINIVFELNGTPKYIFDNTTKKVIQECNDVWFSGVQKNYLTISSHSEEMLVVVFNPGSGFSLLHESVDQYTNKVVPAIQVFGASITKLYQKLKAPTLPEQKFLDIEQWILQRLKPDDFYSDIINFAIDALQQNGHELKINDLVRQSGYSQKQFIQIFKKYVGLTPKQLQRIIRFNDLLAEIEHQNKLSWTAIANEFGYFDQAHFIKDFQSFSGINPKQYLSDIGDYPNYIPVK